MSYVSFSFYVFLAAVFLCYYAFPIKHRWLVLLAGSIVFYFLLFSSPAKILIFFGTAILAWLLGFEVERRDGTLVPSMILTGIPFWFSRFLSYSPQGAGAFESVFVPVGCAFYTLQIWSYLIDIDRKKIRPEENILHFFLFITWFPQILEGPIPRYSDLMGQMIRGHRFEGSRFVSGCFRILWGFFLKMMIADKAGLFVDAVFADPASFSGGVCLLAGILYSIQLYADFMACTRISQGVSELFGIELSENFNRPYLATSIAQFWRRWHMSLSFWLRDYVYIPLGGSRRGKARKYLNILITFLVSGIWHGNGFRFLFWGMLHGLYQVLEGITGKGRKHLPGAIRRAVTLLAVMLAWVIFRADSLEAGLFLWKKIFSFGRGWAISPAQLFSMAPAGKEWLVLFLSTAVLVIASLLEERAEKRGKSSSIAALIMEKPAGVRIAAALALIFAVSVFGTYGAGYDSADFIYGGF